MVDSDNPSDQREETLLIKSKDYLEKKHGYEGIEGWSELSLVVKGRVIMREKLEKLVNCGLIYKIKHKLT